MPSAAWTCSRRCFFESFVSSSGSSTFSKRVEHRDEVVHLEDEADVARAPARQRVSVKREISLPSTTMRPPVGRSMPAMRLSSVVLPEPDGPMSARKSPRGTASVTPLSTGTSNASRL